MGINRQYIGRPDGSNPDSWYSYTCGHCASKVSGIVTATYLQPGSPNLVTKWLLCPDCQLGSVACPNGEVVPGVLFGPRIEGLPKPVEQAYEEARRCLSSNANTACELICRKILMHVAVEKGAKEGEPFGSYLSFLEAQGYVTPPMKPWVELIRHHGNEATHRLQQPEQSRAEGTMMFTAELLRLIYEMDHLARRYVPSGLEPTP